ncbi:MAG TPA: MBL fold metallo-hydrolase [Phototrophicaceae bacterium]|nr:MBL fold metallo-hydrolase [Phototrophicaceae bacterium]
MTSLNIHFLGTGSASPNKERQNSSLLLEFGGRSVLVDASGYPGQSVLQAGVSFDRLRDIILTHAHVDHLYALPSVVSSIASYDLSGSPKRLRFYGLPETLDVARRLVEIFVAPSKSMGALSLDYIALNPDPLATLPLDLPDWNVQAFRVNHGGIPALGLSLRSGAETHIVYSGDAVADEAIYAQVTPETTCLIHDCASGMAMTARTNGHAGAAELNLLLRARQPRVTYITHLSARQDAVLPQMLECLAEGYSGEVSAAYDGLSLAF